MPTRHSPGPSGASEFLPEDRGDLAALGEASRSCRGCGLHREATQTVFGAGAAQPDLVLVGEAPGEREDLDGSPFVGPAGGVLRRALDEAGIEIARTYRTNAVKHFKFERRGEGKARIHKKPSSSETVACRPWLLAELDATRPTSVVALGATAARSLLGAPVRVTEERGRVLRLDGLPPVVATYHPSAVLRAAGPSDREALRAMLVADLALAASVSAATRRGATPEVPWDSEERSMTTRNQRRR